MVRGKALHRRGRPSCSPRGGALLPHPPRTRGNASALLSVAGIAVGVMTLTVVLAVMNGFQLGFIDNIVEISSYHMQSEAGRQRRPPPPAGGCPRGEAARSSASAAPSPRDRPRPVRPAAGPDRGAFQAPCLRRPRRSTGLFARDPSRPGCLLRRGTAPSLTGNREVVLGTELAATGARVGDALSLGSYAGGPTAARRRGAPHSA